MEVPPAYQCCLCRRLVDTPVVAPCCGQQQCRRCAHQLFRGACPGEALTCWRPGCTRQIRLQELIALPRLQAEVGAFKEAWQLRQKALARLALGAAPVEPGPQPRPDSVYPAPFPEFPETEIAPPPKKPKKAKLCYLCQEFGHATSRCPGLICKRCGQSGHAEITCSKVGTDAKAEPTPDERVPDTGTAQEEKELSGTVPLHGDEEPGCSDSENACPTHTSDIDNVDGMVESKSPLDQSESSDLTDMFDCQEKDERVETEVNVEFHELNPPEHQIGLAPAISPNVDKPFALPRPVPSLKESSDGRSQIGLSSPASISSCVKTNTPSACSKSQARKTEESGRWEKFEQIKKDASFRRSSSGEAADFEAGESFDVEPGCEDAASSFLSDHSTCPEVRDIFVRSDAFSGELSEQGSTLQACPDEGRSKLIEHASDDEGCSHANQSPERDREGTISSKKKDLRRKLKKRKREANSPANSGSFLSADATADEELHSYDEHEDGDGARRKRKKHKRKKDKKKRRDASSPIKDLATSPIEISSEEQERDVGRGGTSTSSTSSKELHHHSSDKYLGRVLWFNRRAHQGRLERFRAEGMPSDSSWDASFCSSDDFRTGEVVLFSLTVDEIRSVEKVRREISRAQVAERSLSSAFSGTYVIVRETGGRRSKVDISAESRLEVGDVVSLAEYSDTRGCSHGREILRSVDLNDDDYEGKDGAERWVVVIVDGQVINFQGHEQLTQLATVSFGGGGLVETFFRPIRLSRRSAFRQFSLLGVTLDTSDDEMTFFHREKGSMACEEQGDALVDFLHKCKSLRGGGRRPLYLYMSDARAFLPCLLRQLDRYGLLQEFAGLVKGVADLRTVLASIRQLKFLSSFASNKFGLIYSHLHDGDAMPGGMSSDLVAKTLWTVTEEVLLEDDLEESGAFRKYFRSMQVDLDDGLGVGNAIQSTVQLVDLNKKSATSRGRVFSRLR